MMINNLQKYQLRNAFFVKLWRFLFFESQNAKSLQFLMNWFFCRVAVKFLYRLDFWISPIISSFRLTKWQNLQNYDFLKIWDPKLQKKINSKYYNLATYCVILSIFERVIEFKMKISYFSCYIKNTIHLTIGLNFEIW